MRTSQEREDQRGQVMAAIAETPIVDPLGRGLRFDQVIEAITGQAWNRAQPAEQSRIRADLHALRRRGLVVEDGSPGGLWTYWRLAVPEDEDDREDIADIRRLMQRWEPAP